MEIVGESSLKEYAKNFWERQKTKKESNDSVALANIERGDDPLKWLRDMYSYKLPRLCNDTVKIAKLNKEDVESLLIHDYMPNDKWMQERKVVPEPYTRRLKNLADTFINRGYFDATNWVGDKQKKYYNEWKERHSLRNVFSEKPLIECVGAGDYEIIDGWGRLLPFVVLLNQGRSFQPVECFVALRKD